MMGSDGKYYKVDLRGTSSDPREIFGVTPSQLALYDNSSTIKRSRVVSTSRSSRTNLTNLRPNSANKY